MNIMAFINLPKPLVIAAREMNENGFAESYLAL